MYAKQIKQQLFLTRETTCHKYSLFVEETLLDKEREIKRRISFSSDPSFFPRDTQHHNHSRKPTHLRQLSRLISPIIFKGLKASGFFCSLANTYRHDFLCQVALCLQQLVNITSDNLKKIKNNHLYSQRTQQRHSFAVHTSC